MSKKALFSTLLVTLITPVLYATPVNFVRGNLLDTDSVRIEIRQESGDCSAQSSHCSVWYSKLSLPAENLEKYSQIKKLDTNNLVLLNISVND
ncbi:MAG: hypothetical protein OJI67_05525, partial [Prosthecobacter sp.]|nr:hypothetical protein [Prosthecobacter sp.]